MLPNFLIIGPQKTGTTWLHMCLSQHPEVFLAKGVKETYFFDRYFDRGAGWYERYFSHAKQGAAVGEVAPTYFAAPEAPSRIRSLCPDVKIVACLRDPVQRSWSAYLDAWRKGDTDLPIEHAIERYPNFLDDSLYSKHLERYYNEFPEKHILVLIHEDITQDYMRVLSRLFQFIGVDTEYSPTRGDRKVNKFRAPRFRMIAHASTRTARALHRYGLHGLVNFGKTMGVQNFVYRNSASSNELMSQNQRNALNSYFSEEVQCLSSILDRDLAALWLK